MKSFRVEFHSPSEPAISVKADSFDIENGFVLFFRSDLPKFAIAADLVSKVGEAEK